MPDRFETVEQLRDALIAGGYDCPAWTRDDRVTLALQSGQCSTQDVLMIFTGESAVHAAVQNFKEMGTSVVVGQNWIVNPHTPIAVTHAIGGTIVRGDEVPAGVGADLSSEERIFLSQVRYSLWSDSEVSDEVLLRTAGYACAVMADNEFPEAVEILHSIMPEGSTDVQAQAFTILSVMDFCDEHEGKLP